MRDTYQTESTSSPRLSATGINMALYQQKPSRLWIWCGLAIFVHLLVLGLWALVIFLLLLFHIQFPMFDAQPKPRDTEFTLVDNTPVAKPRHKTRLRAEHDSRSGGKKVNQMNQLSQKSTGAPSKRQPTAPAAQPTPAPKKQAPARPTPRPQQAHQPTPRPAPPRPNPSPVKAAPSPTPAPAPRLPRPVKPSQTSPTPAPNPIAPTIRTPAPKNPSASASGPVVKTPSANSGGGSPSGGNPGPQMIAGNPSRGGSSSGGNPGSPGRSGGRSGGGGSSSYNQSGSPGGGGGADGIDAQADVDMGPYVNELQRRIKRNWAPPAEDRNKRVVVRFIITRSGGLQSVSITQSSGSQAADQAALAAVRLSAPFRQLPPGFRQSTVPVDFTFDYQVMNGARLR